MSGRAPAAPFTALDLGFVPLAENSGPDGETLAWTKRVGGAVVAFRILRALADLVPVEAIQREVMGAGDLDISAASALVTTAETGGDVIGAFLQDGGGEEELAGMCVGYGGWFAGRPRLVSDMLAVRSHARSKGLGAELKKLQAAVAVARGFAEMVWTVDPLRAPNARLNVEKLGARCRQYEIDRYGAGYGTGLYGGLPADRLHMTWELRSARVRRRLLGARRTPTPADLEDLEHFDPARLGAERCFVHLPRDIDALLATDWNAAHRWRLTLRETLPRAFAAGYEIDGFVPDVDPERGYSAYLLSRTVDRDDGSALPEPHLASGGTRP